MCLEERHFRLVHWWQRFASMEWVKELLTNSCDITLVKCVNEKFDQLYEYEQGGITYLKIALDKIFTISNMVIMLLQKYRNSLIRKVLLRYQMRMYKSAWNRLLPCVCVLPRLMRSLKRHQDISLRGLLSARLWNSKIFISSLQLLLKSIRCGQSVGGGTALLLLLQLQNSAVRLMRCSTPWIWQINGTFPRITGLMSLLHSVTIVDCLNAPVTNILYHAMKQRSWRLRRLKKLY